MRKEKNEIMREASRSEIFVKLNDKKLRFKELIKSKIKIITAMDGRY